MFFSKLSLRSRIQTNFPFIDYDIDYYYNELLIISEEKAWEPLDKSEQNQCAECPAAQIVCPPIPRPPPLLSINNHWVFPSLQDTVIYDRLADSSRYKEITLKHLEQFATEGEWTDIAPCLWKVKHPVTCVLISHFTVAAVITQSSAAADSFFFIARCCCMLYMKSSRSSHENAEVIGSHWSWKKQHLLVVLCSYCPLVRPQLNDDIGIFDRLNLTFSTDRGGLHNLLSVLFAWTSETISSLYSLHVVRPLTYLC